MLLKQADSSEPAYEVTVRVAVAAARYLEGWSLVVGPSEYPITGGHDDGQGV